MGNDGYRYYDGIINRTVNFVKVYPAWQVSLQESCYGQAVAIRQRLADESGQNFTLKFGNGSAGTVACAAGSGGFGNTVLAIGGYISDHYQWLTPAPPNPPITEHKNITCLNLQNFGFRTENCTTHTTAYPSGDYTSYTIPQVGNARNVKYLWRAADGAYSLTGTDLNLPCNCGDYYNQRCDLGATNMPAEFQYWDSDDAEAHLPCWFHTIGPAASAQAKMIDYVWADRRLFQQWGRYACTVYGESDHLICPAVLRIP